MTRASRTKQSKHGKAKSVLRPSEDLYNLTQTRVWRSE